MMLRRNQMRNWCAALAWSAFLALPLCAQHKTGAAGEDTANPGTDAEKPPVAAAHALAESGFASAENIFALPALARPKAYAAADDTQHPGHDSPHFEHLGACAVG